MKCLSCSSEIVGTKAHLFRGILVCFCCKELAESAAKDIQKALARAQAQANLWLEQHILKGGLVSAEFKVGDALPLLELKEKA